MLQSVGSHKHGCKNIIKMNIKELPDVSGLGPVTGSVNTVMNLRLLRL
jgi:hypothetical protein